MPPPPKTPGEIVEDFWTHVDKTPTCWLWTAGRHDAGYGMMRRHDRAHRFSWQMANGPIPEGLVLDHLCRVPHCVRPDHLRAVTQHENIFAPGSQWPAIKRRTQTHCKHGHEFTEENTGRVARGRGWVSRFCKTCNRDRMRESYYRKTRPE